ncbi:hypothetical protein GCWU000324_00393 [Kingella oralis ATCC 51147]|jgi:hypothetical protein|uniref:Uncharacterized protein n=1 Tax=Kingella oralis ATCC 51147 TaxID=629741 RepID=C4GHR0_9NEIS|nr:hypothetical protein GCWU000324_00393 [Kingella oralis ATCC 51147]
MDALLAAIGWLVMADEAAVSDALAAGCGGLQAASASVHNKESGRSLCFITRSFAEIKN